MLQLLQPAPSDDDGFILWESAAINLYLAEQYKSHNSQLYPLTRGQRQASQSTFFVTNEAEAAVIAILRERIILPLEQRNRSSTRSSVSSCFYSFVATLHTVRGARGLQMNGAATLHCEVGLAVEPLTRASEGDP